MMSKSFSLALAACLGLGISLAGCKADTPDTTASGTSGTSGTSGEASGPASGTSDSSAQPRSGKIDMPRRKPSGDLGAPVTPGTPDSTDRERPRLSREEMQQRRAERMAKIDTDGNGVLDEKERAAARHERAQAMHARFDADGDGKLTPDELAQSRRGRLSDPSVDTNQDGQISVDELDKAMGDRSGRWGMRGERRMRPGDAGSGSAQ